MFLIGFHYLLAVSPAKAVHVGDGDALEESHDEEGNVAREIIEENENVVPGAVSENHADCTTHTAYHRCGVRRSE